MAIGSTPVRVALVAAIFALGVLVMVAWFMLRWTSAYGYFGLAAMCWTLHSALVLAIDIPVPTLVWEVLIVASLVWMRLVEKTTPDRWDLIGGVVCLVGAGIILFGPRG